MRWQKYTRRVKIWLHRIRLEAGQLWTKPLALQFQSRKVNICSSVQYCEQVVLYSQLPMLVTSFTASVTGPHCNVIWVGLNMNFLFSQHLSSLDLNVVVLTDSITSLGRLFHSFTTLGVKKCFLRLVRLLFIFSFNAWPLVLLCPSRVSRFVVTDWSYRVVGKHFEDFNHISSQASIC